MRRGFLVAYRITELAGPISVIDLAHELLHLLWIANQQVDDSSQRDSRGIRASEYIGGEVHDQVARAELFGALLFDGGEAGEHVALRLERRDIEFAVPFERGLLVDGVYCFERKIEYFVPGLHCGHEHGEDGIAEEEFV